MSDLFRIFFGRNKLRMACFATLCLLSIQSASAFAPRLIEFGAQKEQASDTKMLVILGEVKKPATYQVHQKEITLADLIKLAGGVTTQSGRKVRILRGGRSAMILLRPSQDGFKLSSGDVIILDRKWATSSKTISFKNIVKPSFAPGPNGKINRATLQQNKKPVHHGQIVLLGLKAEPVVLPLWTDNLTVKTLLTTWMKQSDQTAAGTRIILGRKAGSHQQKLLPGMVLRVPADLVEPAKLPRLPLTIQVDEKGNKVELEQKTSQVLPPASAYLVTPTSKAEMARYEPMGSMIPDVAAYQFLQTSTPDDFFLPAEPTQALKENNVEESISSTTTPVTVAEANLEPITLSIPEGQELFSVSDPHANSDFRANSDPRAKAKPLSSVPFQDSAEDDFTQLLEQKQAQAQNYVEEIHPLWIGEKVPEPLEPESASGPSLLGFVAGAIVIIGVLTVIVSALRNQMKHPELALEELAVSPMQKQHNENKTEQHQQVPAQPSVQAKTAPGISDPLTRAKEQKENSLEALLADQIPVIEERVLLPRELKFFGKPNVYYEFRLDASHDLKKPHLVSMRDKNKQQQIEENSEIHQSKPHLASRKKEKQKHVAVYWEGEAGLFVSSQNLYQATTETNQ